VRTPGWRERPLLGRRGVRRVLPPRQSLLVLGPTQCGKTSSLVIPAVLRWRGPVVVASVKDDVWHATATWRAQRGPVAVVQPSHGPRWEPVADVTDWPSAWRVARDLTESPQAGRSSDHDFWSSLAARFLAGLLVAAAEQARSTSDVAWSVAQRAVPPWATAVRDATARLVLEGVAALDPRTFDSVATTADAVLTPWLTPGPPVAVRTTIQNGGTVYLVAPRRDHATYESLFRGAVRAALTAHEAHPAQPLLVVLDEAASIAPLPDLDELAATAAGLNITLVSIFQDGSQIAARFGDRAGTIVNNHATRLVVAGLSDPTLGRLVPELVAEGMPSLRTLRPRTARLMTGSHPVTTVRLVPWWRYRALRVRGRRERVSPWSFTTPPILDSSRTPSGI
jgi:type IV secretion system protein VirD4